jgi:hypothetical protein
MREFIFLTPSLPYENPFMVLVDVKTRDYPFCARMETVLLRWVTLKYTVTELELFRCRVHIAQRAAVGRRRTV